MARHAVKERHGRHRRGTVIHWARAYDVVVWLHTLGRERRFRDRLADLAHLAPGESVLDVGCGTGALAMQAKRRVGSQGQVCGADPSPEMVARARRKAARAGVDVRFETAGIEALPFPDGSFDAVIGTLMLHHLTDESRRKGIQEIFRVTKPGGRFVAVDIGGEKKRKKRKKHHGLLSLPAHAEFDLDELAPELEGAGLAVVEQGPVDTRGVIGLPSLRFLRAVRHPR